MLLLFLFIVNLVLQKFCGSLISCCPYCKLSEIKDPQIKIIAKFNAPLAYFPI